MDVFSRLGPASHKQVDFHYDAGTGLKMIVAIHNDVLGPTLGGVRMMDYGTEEEAMADALRLSEAMTYKCGIIGAEKGGCKSVIIGKPEEKTPELLRAIGRVINSYGGRVVTGVDIGLTLDDAVLIHEETDYIVARPESDGSWGKSGTQAAYGVYIGMKEVAKYRWDGTSLDGLSVLVQGLGYLGENLVPLLVEAGAVVKVSDLDEEAVRRMTERFPGLEVVPAHEVYETECDIFSPCAVGGIINDETVEQLHCEIVAGGANNQLLDPMEHERRLREHNILWAPDFLINSGGVINAICEVEGRTRGEAKQWTEQIGQIVTRVMDKAIELDASPLEIARQVVDARIAERLGS